MTLFPHQSGQKRAVLASICPPVDPVHPHHLSRASCSEIDSDKINHWWGRARVRMFAIIIVIAVRRKVRIDYGHFYRGGLVSNQWLLVSWSPAMCVHSEGLSGSKRQNLRSTMDTCAQPARICPPNTDYCALEV